MQVAKQRQKEYTTAIAKKQAEIDEMKEYIEDLENFIEFGASLLSTTQMPKDAIGDKVVPKDSVDKKKASDADDEWNSDALNKKMERVLPTRAG
jgi:hypothetical protein